MLFVLFLMMLFVIIILTVVLVTIRRNLKLTEDISRRLVPAMVDSMLALTDAQRTIRDILSLVPIPSTDGVRADAKLEAAIQEAIGVTRTIERFAPVIPLHAKDRN